MTDHQYTPIEVAIALSLYAYNVPATDRAFLIYDYFGGDCMDRYDLVSIMLNTGSVVTELPYPSAVVYVQQALDKYGAEAVRRVKMNRG